jgi:hypothetical protein
MRVLLLALVAFSVNAQVIEEQYYIPKKSHKLIKFLQKHKALTIDHVSRNGFELYGPKGLSEFLDNNKIDYLEMPKPSQKSLQGYLTYEKMTSILKDMAKKNPAIFKLFSIGQTVQGRELWVMKISDNVKRDEVEPEVKYISSMHGDEIVGRELMMILLAEIATKYGKDKNITNLVNNTEIFIMPSMNPDGSLARRRANGSGRDLNRNFPEIFSKKGYFDDREPETMAVMKFQASRQFALSANFHGGAVCVNYPWDSTLTRHPFDKLIKDISLEYSKRNPEMINSREFEDGITNGADWYVVRGGMQDWSYVFFNDLQVTVELSGRKWPNYNTIKDYYKKNQASLMYYLTAVHQGAGFRIQRSGVQGTVKIEDEDGKDLGSYKFRNSEFYKVLEPGRYTFFISSGSVRKSIDVKVDFGITRGGNYTYIN